ncbi:hypothetical protein IU459_15900 [Nocardia amamiensis]|uniref:ATPase n=1 Tax=Nocardia amamiensis TaxID=404578 RepID=A0ABS0CR05_9NOCA|nr:hypothetical protein [Nocardia amamiensis]MBF6299016.1 hypothetical protein [Nocardia amamiensis]
MRPWRDFLERFRPAGTPGAAVLRGIPADRAHDIAGELEPVLALLDHTQAHAERIRADAVDRARERRDDARRRSEEIIAAARDSVESIRVDALTHARMEAAAERADQAEAASAEIEQMRARVSARLPGYVERVLAEVRAMADGKPARRTRSASGQ